MNCRVLVVLCLVFGLKVVAAQSTGTLPLRQGQLSGIYRADGVNPNGHFYLTFFADGRVKRNRPDEGLDRWDDVFWMNLDLRSGDRTRIFRWGTYRISGDQGQIAFAKGDTWNFRIKDPQTLEAVGRTYVLLGSGNGLSLQGTYKSVKGDASITFTPDGQVVEQGVTSNCQSAQSYSYGGRVPTAHTGSMLCSDKARSGRYRIANYTLTFSFSDTSSPSSVFWVEPGAAGADKRVLYIDNVKYERAR